MDRLWKCSLTFIVAIAIATAALADKLPANRHILVIADTEHGLALVPVGTPIPRGLALRVEQEKAVASFVRQPMRDDSALRADCRESQIQNYFKEPLKRLMTRQFLASPD